MLQDFSSLTQAMTGVVALIISIVTLLQSKKINELVEMVKELKNQNLIMKKQYELQLESSLL